MASILIVDDEPNLRRMLGRLLEEAGHDIAEAGDVSGALAALETDAPDVMLLDLALPDGSGIDVLTASRARRPDMPVVMISGRATLADAVAATKSGAFHFIEKPLTPEAVLLTVSGALELVRARELSRTIAADAAAGSELVGDSAPMRAVHDWIERVAATDARLLISGESGTGKELVAAAVHRCSRRSAAPFVRVNSAAIPRELVESEMFGHERGAFTGAASARRGRFELAAGGTLFLDEVGDLGVGAQAKLLRAIETGTIERVGGERAIHVDVRVIAATNRDLAEETRAGRFRRDLFYRLDVVPITLPPLRTRRDDIEALLVHFFARLHARLGSDPPRLTPRAVACLGRYDWPGNVRELANVCERLAILRAGQVVDAAIIEAMLGQQGTAEVDASLAEQLASFERRTIEAALDAANGSVGEAAKRLRTDRANLYRRMRRLGIRR
jgi:two-component system, NtrC family, nitrogen regulation response regulator NtrX